MMISALDTFSEIWHICTILAAIVYGQEKSPGLRTMTAIAAPAAKNSLFSLCTAPFGLALAARSGDSCTLKDNRHSA
jgi:hypothetical protein